MTHGQTLSRRPWRAASLNAVVTAKGLFTIRRMEAWGKKNANYFIVVAPATQMNGPEDQFAQWV
jgi:hypothetical protein